MANGEAVEESGFRLTGPGGGEVRTGLDVVLVWE